MNPRYIDVDVVIPSAAAAEDVAETLMSLSRETQRIDANVRVFVVDDRGGRPEVAAAARRFDAECLVTDAVGCGGARNVGADAGEAPWILFLDDDISLCSGSLDVLKDLPDEGADAVVGALMAPDSCQTRRWLAASYRTGAMAPTAATGRSVSGNGLRMSCALALVRRDTYVAAGRFPDIASWGWEDALFGLRAQSVATRNDWLKHEPQLRGVHRFVPTWAEWIRRQVLAGSRLHSILQTLDGDQRAQFLEAVGLGPGRRANLKRALGLVPSSLWWPSSVPWVARAAAAGAFARGYRQAARGR